MNEEPQDNHDIVVVGGSAGGIEAVQQLLRPLPRDVPAAVVVVLHTGLDSPRVLDRIIGRSTELDCVYAEHGMEIQKGRVHIAPPDYHLILRGGRFELVHGPTENRARPSIDVLFRSAAVSCPGRVVGVVLSGNLDDGAAGLAAIKRCGGLALVQDPDGILYPSMPSSALGATDVDGCWSLPKLPGALLELVHRPVPHTVPEVPRLIEIEVEMVSNPTLSIDKIEQIGELSTMTCPDCGGALLEMQEEAWRYRCRVGHAYTADTMVLEQRKTLESALWLALRTLENDLTLHRRMLEREERNERAALARRLHERIGEIEEKAAVLRHLLSR